MKTNLFNRKIVGVRLWEIVTILLVYFLLSLFYNVTLFFNSLGYSNNGKRLFSLLNWFDDGGLQYILMFFATILIWLLIFRLCKHWKLSHRFLLHFIGLPFFLFVAQKVYYLTCELLDMGYLKGTGQVWDIYIPTLIYLIQFSIFHAYEYYVVNQKKLRNEIELKNAALKSELSALKAQLNPHFLYNVFNTINASVPAEMEETREMIADLSDLFRYQLKASKEDLVSLGDELDFVRRYLELEKKRFEDRLTINYYIPNSLLNEQIPPMILQPIVENAVKQGISPLLEGGEINISIHKEKNNLVFEVKDNGVGIENKEGIFEKGVGLGNTQLRLQKLYQSEIKITDNHPTGLIVSFSL